MTQSTGYEMIDQWDIMRRIADAAPAWSARYQQQQECTHRLWQRLASDRSLRDRVQKSLRLQNLPVWMGDLMDTVPIAACDEDYQVIGVDGSQIYPNHHEGSSWYVTTVGICHIAYAEKSFMRCETRAAVGTLEQADEAMVALERTLRECETALTLASEYQDALVMLDGTLYPPLTVAHSYGYGNRSAEIMAEWQRAQPRIISCISRPLSTYTTDLFEVAAAAVGMKEMMSAPDRIAIAYMVPEGHRSPLWQAPAPVGLVDVLHPIWFYLTLHGEVLRVEMPAYAAEHVDRVAARIVDQVAKGFGYPIALAEAHVQATVTERDRQLWYRLIDVALEQHGVTRAWSHKRVRKQTIPL